MVLVESYAFSGKTSEPMQNDPRSHGLWEKSAPAAPPTAALLGDVTADVVIIGGGYTGLSAALHLAEQGRKIVVLEGVDIGFGGSGRNVGLVNAGMWVMPKDLPAVLGEVHGERLLDLLGDGPNLVYELVEKHQIACEAVRAGTLHCAVGADGLAQITERAAQWQARGAPVSLLSADETARKVGTSAYTGALLDRRAGTIQPLAYVRGLAQAAMMAGAEIFTQSPVLGAERTGASWKVRTDKGSVTADWVIVATNAYTVAPWNAIRSEIMHLPYFNYATKPLSDNLRRSILPEGQGAWDTKEILSSFRMDQAGRLVLGSVGALRGTGDAVHQAWAKRAMRKLFPQLGEIEFESGWYGQIGMTDNSLPKFHQLDENVISFSGYNGRGIAPGTVFGKVLAGHISGEIALDALPLPVTEPKPQAFLSIKELYYEAGAQIAHLAGERI
jgi:glycine/D-amino acid oxidase-like deaminating enzyme